MESHCSCPMSPVDRSGLGSPVKSLYLQSPLSHNLCPTQETTPGDFLRHNVRTW